MSYKTFGKYCIELKYCISKLCFPKPQHSWTALNHTHTQMHTLTASGVNFFYQIDLKFEGYTYVQLQALLTL